VCRDTEPRGVCYRHHGCSALCLTCDGSSPRQQQHTVLLCEPQCIPCCCGVCNHRDVSARRHTEYDCVRIHVCVAVTYRHLVLFYYHYRTLHSHSSIIPTVVDIGTTARCRAVGVTPTSITRRATTLGMLWWSWASSDLILLPLLLGD